MSLSRRAEEHQNHEAWAIPYGDLVTLLMAFFVVMYAISSVDAGKYRVLSDSMIEAFGTPGRVEPIQVGEPTSVGDEQPRTLAPLPLPADHRPGANGSPTELAVESALDAAPEEQRQAVRAQIASLAQEMESALGTYVGDDLIRVRRESFWLEIEINTSLLFPSGSATLETVARPVLTKVAGLLAARPARIHVEGHTDNVPISNPVYPSNWELSSGRAANVVSLFAQHGVDPERMVAIGYGEFQPVAGNDTPEGRARNRRVSIVVLPGVSQRSRDASEPERLRSDYQGVPVQPEPGSPAPGSMRPPPAPVATPRGIGQL